MDTQRALKVLGLEPGATPEAIRQTYRDLAKVWHPDRFANDPRLRVRADEKLKEINEAYAVLQAAMAGGTVRPDAPPPPRGARPDAPAPPRWTPPPAPRTPARRRAVPAWGLALIALGLLAGVLAAVLTTARRNAATSGNPVTDADTAASGTFERERVVTVPGMRPAPSPAPARARTPAAAAPIAEAPVEGRGTQWFTVGSTKDEVLAVQGRPNRYSDLDWRYGRSRVMFTAGRVSGWDVAPRSPLRVRLLPERAVTPSAPTFTVGSTKDEVLAIQGTPTGFNESVWRYGASAIHFRDGRVADWSTAPSDPLRAMAPERPAQVTTWFTVGSTKDEVLRVQGPPTEFQELRWRYHLSWVYFSGGRVAGWDIVRNFPLNVRLLPSDPAVRAQDFTVGSTHDEVLVAQGTPDAFNAASWRYGGSVVYFTDGRVTRWDVRPDAPLHIRPAPR